MKHWTSFYMTPRQAFEFEVFKVRNVDKIKGWRIAHPDLKTTPPIFWNGVHWFWQEIKPNMIAIYKTKCEAIAYARTIKSRDLPD